MIKFFVCVVDVVDGVRGVASCVVVVVATVVEPSVSLLVDFEDFGTTA